MKPVVRVCYLDTPTIRPQKTNNLKQRDPLESDLEEQDYVLILGIRTQAAREVIRSRGPYRYKTPSVLRHKGDQTSFV